MTLPIGTAKIPMTPEIPEFFHAMHDKHTVEAEKQSLRNGTAGFIPMDCQEKPYKKLIHRMNAAIIGILGHDKWGYTGLWSNRLPRGGFHVEHTHPKGWMSGICYLDVPDTESGNLVFEGLTIKPQTGDVVVFPSTLKHSVSVYQGEKPRLVVAFDLLRMA